MLKSATFWIIILLFVIVLDYYLFQAIKTATRNKNWAIIAVITDLILTMVMFFVATNIQRTPKDSDMFQMVSSLFFIIFVPKLVLVLPMMIEDLIRFIKYLLQTGSPDQYYPDRRRAISLLALGAASITFFGVFYGIVKGKFNYRVRRLTLKLPDLPESFRGLKIVQISDIHSGSFHKSAIPEIERGIKIINDEDADLVLFTGDLVNLVADEVIPYKETFAKIRAKMGKYSILGNHDYGDYYYHKDEEKNIENRAQVDQHLKDMGFTQLRNQHVKIEKGEDFINLVGVENFGAEMRFPRTGDLNKATEGMELGTTNILMSHDPTHFDHDLPNYTNVINFHIPMHLTLSGHTHGAQLGIDYPDVFKFSPAQFFYKNWAGLCQEKGKYLYVNVGFGYLGFPGRVGIWPEITVFTIEPED